MFSLFLLVLMKSSRESLPHWIMLLETFYSVFGKSLTIDLTYTVSQTVHILNTYEISSRINLQSSTLKQFTFNELDSEVFKIIALGIMSNLEGGTLYKWLNIKDLWDSKSGGKRLEHARDSLTWPTKIPRKYRSGITSHCKKKNNVNSWKWFLTNCIYCKVSQTKSHMISMQKYWTVTEMKMGF